MFDRLSRIIPLFVELVLFVYIVTGLHEMFHYLIAHAEGIYGYVTFGPAGFFGAFFHYPEGVTILPWQDATIGLAGGLGTALVFGLLWLMFAWQGRKSVANLDEAFCAGVITVNQFIYGISEAITYWHPVLSSWLEPVGMTIGVIVPIILYFPRILNWWTET